MGLLFLLALIIFVLVQRDQRLRRASAYSAAKNRHALGVSAAIESGKQPRPFSIYLRPFFSDGNIKKQIGFGPTPSDAELVDLQSVLTDAMVSTSPLEALGRSQNNVSAGLVDVGEEAWWDAVKKRIVHAEIVFLLPSGTAGTIAELEFVVANKYLRKTIFVMPWSILPSNTKADPWRRVWASAQGACERLGLSLPDYSPSGGLFRLGEDGRTFALRHFLTHDPDEVSQVVNDVRYSGHVLFKRWT